MEVVKLMRCFRWSPFWVVQFRFFDYLQRFLLSMNNTGILQLPVLQACSMRRIRGASERIIDKNHNGTKLTSTCQEEGASVPFRVSLSADY